MKPRVREISAVAKLKNFIRQHKMTIKFGVIFVLCLATFSFVLQQEMVQSNFTFPHLNHVAWICGNLMNALGTQCDVHESSILSSRFSVQVVKGCESIYPTVMLWAAIIAFPTRWKWKFAGIIGGAVVLFLLNIIRVVTMFYIGMYLSTIFDMVHIYAWQALFILITLSIFLLWAAYVSKKETTINI